MPLTRPSDPEAELFRRGREVLGKQAGGLISNFSLQSRKTSRSHGRQSSRRPPNPIRANTSAASSAGRKNE
jgi:hypothetical protein